MSWKITKKLKETHLAPLSNPFSRTSSTSTIVPADAEKQPIPVSRTPTSDTTGSSSGFESNSPPTPLKPGILVVTLHEGRGFSLPKDAERLFEQRADPNSFQQSASVRPNSSTFGQPGATNSYVNNGRPRTSGGGINDVPTIHGRYSTKWLPYALVDYDKQQIFINAVSGSPADPLWAGDNTQYKFDVSRANQLSISLYVRNPHAPHNLGRTADVLIGTCKITPGYEEVPRSLEDPKASRKDREKAVTAPAHQQQGTGQAGTAWVDLQYGTGSLKVGIAFVQNQQRSLQMDDFDLLKVVGKGSFGKVMQVRKKDTDRIYALKSIRKAHIISRSEVSHTLAERSVLSQINNPFIVPLKFSFQSPEKLYLVLAFVNGGELFHHLQNEHRFEVNRARFYAAELLCALECLHGFNVIYRDLKPENILLDYTGHIALCDFGLCKLDMKDEDTTNTFCGTPEYLAPELLHGHGYTKTVDWWTLGVLLYEMLTGLPPFYDENTNEMYRKILTEPLHFPQDEKIMPRAARDLLTKLLDRRPDHRLGVGGAAEIKAHPFFDGIDWRKLLQRRYDPTFKPNVVDQLDTANFDREFTSEAPADSYVEGPLLSQTVQQQFAGWSYNRPVAGLGDAGGSVKDPSFESVAR